MQPTTRLAPSPTGALHLGNARTFLATWAIARKSGMRIVLRIEDIDGPRIKPESTQQAIDDLAWLGIDWDEGPTVQSNTLDAYHDATHRLLESGHAYACVCTRKEVELASSAPHAEDGSTIYPGTCRGRFATIEQALRETGRPAAVRFALPDETFEFVDTFAGHRSFDLARQIGDFVIAKPASINTLSRVPTGEGRGEGPRDPDPHPSPLPVYRETAFGAPAYQLAVVVDDAKANVTDVIRGDDLLDSVPRQVLLYRALGLADRIPTYTHLPLVIGEDGRRLAKRHGDTRLSTYRAAGVTPDRMRAFLARWLGIACGDSITASEIVERFDLSRVPREPIVFREADHRWLSRS